jgi:hypothetical protein
VTVSGAYNTGFLLGAKMVLSGATRIANGKAIIETVTVSDGGISGGVGLAVVFFEANPTSTTFTDRGYLTMNGADLLNIVGAVQIFASDYVGFTTNCVATRTGLGLEFNSTDTNLYACIVSNDSPSYFSSATMQLTVGILQVS